MSIDKFGLGGWWPRPDQAASGGLDHLPADQWPTLAARWLAAGYDSPLLRQLAELRAGRHGVGPASTAAHPLSTVSPSEYADILAERKVVRQAQELMPEAMRSIGFDPAPADEAFVARCQSALDIVQHDLDATGYGRYQLRASFGQGWPAELYPTFPDGSYWGTQGITRGEDGSWLLLSVAGLVSGTLKEIPEIEWPVCAVHGGHPESIWHGEEPVGLIKNVPWWHCTNTGHPLSPVGHLTAEIAKTP